MRINEHFKGTDLGFGVGGGVSLEKSNEVFRSIEEVKIDPKCPKTGEKLVKKSAVKNG